jgi:hypothetical protein
MPYPSDETFPSPDLFPADDAANLSALGAYLYEALGPIAEPFDARRGYPLRAYADAIGSMFQPVFDLVDDPEILLDPDRTPVDWLPWLSQFIPGGVQISPQANLPQRPGNLAPNPSAEDGVLPWALIWNPFTLPSPPPTLTSEVNAWATSGTHVFHHFGDVEPGNGSPQSGVGLSPTSQLSASIGEVWTLTADVNVLHLPDSDGVGTVSPLYVALQFNNALGANITTQVFAYSGLGSKTVTVSGVAPTGAATVRALFYAQHSSAAPLGHRTNEFLLDNIRMTVVVPSGEGYRVLTAPLLKDPPAARRGTVPAIVEEVQRFLNPPQTVFTVERQGGNMYIGAISVINSEIIPGHSVADIQARVNAVAPAARIITVSGINGADWLSVRDTHTDWSDVRSTFVDWGEVRSNPTKQ